MSKFSTTICTTVATAALLLATTSGCSDSKPTGAKKSADKNTQAKKQAETPEEKQPTKSDAPAGKVMLGSDELFVAIPGEGELTVEQIQAWLDDDKNHATLDHDLPLGLATGKGQEKGLDKNPLTRAKIELGRQLFFDKRLSVDNTISCASCHLPEHGYAANTQFGQGINGPDGKPLEGDRNSPVAYNRILSGPQFWDGRAASLEEQAVGPIANPIEMGNTHEKAVATLKAIPGYKMQFDKIFGGTTIDAVGQAIASFERAVVTGPTPFDYFEQFNKYASYDPEDIEEWKEEEPEQYASYKEAKKLAAANAMSDSAVRGRELFFGQKASCSACHFGPNLADELYHNLGIGMDKPETHSGRFSKSKAEKDRGAFKTPTIRNVAQTPPYMHDGSLKTLEEVVEWYAKGGHPNPHLSDKVKKLDLTDQDKKDLVEFMKSVTGDLPKVESGRLPKSGS
jgi:cytochrome c peroxidase